jgi:hypothetical protein
MSAAAAYEGLFRVFQVAIPVQEKLAFGGRRAILTLDPHRGGNRYYPKRQSAGGGVMILRWVFWFRASSGFGPLGRCRHLSGRSCLSSFFSFVYAFGPIVPRGNPRFSY